MKRNKKEWATNARIGEVYSISDTGEVRNNKTGTFYKFFERTGYSCLKIEGKTESIHRLVAEAFIPNPDNKPWVNHRNLNKRDNRISNLEWCTPKENTAHAIQHKAFKSKGENHPRGRLRNFEVILIKLFFNLGRSSEEIADLFKIGRRHANGIKSGESWGHLVLEVKK